MLDVKKYFCCFMCVIVGLTTVVKLEVLYINFGYNQVLLFVGNDVIVLSPLVGAVSDFSWRILKGQPRLNIMLDWHFVSILNRLEVIQLYSFGWDFSIWGYFRVVFRGYHPPKLVWYSSNIQKALSCTNPRILSYQWWSSVQAFRL